MRIIREKYKFIIETRQVRIGENYEETEFKQARVFMKNLTRNNKLVVKSTSRIVGESQAAVIQYRHGMTEPTEPQTINNEVVQVPVSDSITAYVPIDKLHYGEWAVYRLDGDVSEALKYSGVEVGGVQRRRNSNTIYAGQEQDKAVLI
jgi:hypothetical protein